MIRVQTEDQTLDGTHVCVRLADGKHGDAGRIMLTFGDRSLTLDAGRDELFLLRDLMSAAILAWDVQS